MREARQGHAVAVAIPAEAGMHAVTGLILDLAGDHIDVVEVPAITAEQASAAPLGSPLGAYSAVISPRERTPWEVTTRQVQAAAEADFVITFCPSPGRPPDRQLRDVLAILRQSRPPDTPSRWCKMRSAPASTSGSTP